MTSQHRLRRQPWHKILTLGKTGVFLLAAVATFALLSVLALVTGIGLMLGAAGLVSGLL